MAIWGLDYARTGATDAMDRFDTGVEQGQQAGRIGRSARAYRSGGLPAVAEAAGNAGDMEQYGQATQEQRTQEDQTDQHHARALEWFNTSAPYALNALKVARSRGAAGAQFLASPQVRQRFSDMGFSPEQIDGAIQHLSTSDDATRNAFYDELEGAFTQHHDPNWTVSQYTGQAQALDPDHPGQFITGGMSPDAPQIAERARIETQDKLRDANAPYPHSGSGSGAGGGFNLDDVRQWGTAYDGAQRQNLDGLGIMRPALPYARIVAQHNGDTRNVQGVNARMSDVALLRAAARAQTGPGVLTESEVFGTLSPSLQQALTQNRAYVDIAQTVLSPRDRLALANYVQRAAGDAQRQVWQTYQDYGTRLGRGGASPDDMGIAAPPIPHPDDESALRRMIPTEDKVGSRAVTPSGRVYSYEGQGNWIYRDMYGRTQGQSGQAPAPQSQGAAPSISQYDAQGNPIQ